MKPLLIGTIGLLTIALVPAPAQAYGMDGICTLTPEGAETPFPGVPFWKVKQNNQRIEGIVQWVPVLDAANPTNGWWRFTGECAFLDVIEEVVECTWQLTTDCPRPSGIQLLPLDDIDGAELPVQVLEALDLKRLPPMPFNL